MVKLGNTVCFAMLLFFSLVQFAWAEGGMTPENPFGSNYFLQGYSPVELIYPNGDKEYTVAETWGLDPKDGKGSVLKSSISQRADIFLTAFGYRFDEPSQKYDIFNRPISAAFMDDPEHGGYGNGKRVDVENPLELSHEEIKQYIDQGIWLFNAAPDAPLPPDPNAPKGYLAVLQFKQPDFQVKSLVAETPEGKNRANAVFRNEYPMALRAKVELFHQVNDTLTPIISELKDFTAFQEISVEGDWAHAGTPGELIIAKVNLINEKAEDKGYIDFLYVPGSEIKTSKERDWTNNKKEINVTSKVVNPINENLKVTITDYTKAASPGDSVQVSAKVVNDKGEKITTRLVWYLNGSIIKDIQNFDVISQQDAAVTFNMPNSDANVTVKVNPDYNQPANETDKNDNIAICTIKKIAINNPVNNGLKVTVNSPSSVQGIHTFNFSVTVSGYFEPPEPPGEPDEVDVYLRVNGSSKKSLGYKFTNGTWGDILQTEVIDVKPSFPLKSFTVMEGKSFSKTFTFTFPACGYCGVDTYATIEASASGGGESGKDVERVLIKGYPVEGFEVIQTQ